MRVLYTIIALALLSGCATTYERCEGLDEAAKAECVVDEKEARRRIDRQNWYTCELVYNLKGANTFHKDHQHPASGHRVKHWMIRQDLARHDCKHILSRAEPNMWVDY